LYGEQVVAICIRNVTGEKIDNARLQAATNGLDDVRFRLFNQPDELYPIIEDIDRMYGMQPDPKH
jgi:hypothetical protein